MRVRKRHCLPGRVRLALTFLIPVMAWALAEWAVAAPPSAADLVDVRQADEVQISPDGRNVAFTVREFPSAAGAAARPRPGVFVVSTEATGQMRRVMPEDRSGRSPRWNPDSSRLALLMDDDKGDTQIFSVSPDDGVLQQVTSFPGGLAGSPALAWSPDGETLAFTAPNPDATAAWRKRGPRVASHQKPRRQLWIVDLDGMNAQAVTSAELDVEALAWAPDGKRLALVAKVDDRNGRSLLTVTPDGRLQRLLSRSAAAHGSRDQTLDWSPNGQRLVFGYTPVPGGTERWLGVVPADGGEVEELLQHYPGHVMRALWLPDSRSLVAQAFAGLSSRLLRVSQDTGTIEEFHEFQAAYPRFSLSEDGTRIAYLGQAVDAPADVHLHVEGREERQLTDLNPSLRNRDLGRVEAISWRNEKDNVELQGVLVTPPEAYAKAPYPLVVQLHGGPHFHWSRGWSGGWNEWAQWLAPRGYAVFLPNPRGSTGRGWAFATAIHHRLGDPDGDDVLSGVDALVARGVADPERLYIGGHSYGGFLTAWLLTRTERFRAAVVTAGISDLVSFAGAAGLREHWSRTYFPDNVQRRMDVYRDRSPLTHLQRVTTPTLILHGEDDPKIPADQAWQLYTGLQNLAVESELIIYPRAGHSLVERSHQLHALENILKWFESHGEGARERRASE